MKNRCTGSHMEIPLSKLEKALRGDFDESLVEVEVDGITVKHLRPMGKRYWFEYHCNESDDSSDAIVWRHSHQQCTLISFDDGEPCFYPTIIERGEAGMVLVYRVRFDDGLEWTVFEDELVDSPDDFYRPDPPTETIFSCHNNKPDER